MPNAQVTQSLESSYGKWAVGYLEVGGRKRQDLVAISVTAFQDLVPGIPPWSPIDWRTCEVGGDQTNDLVIVTPVNISTTEELWREYLRPYSSIVGAETTITPTMLTVRFFDPVVSEEIDAPVIGTSEALIFNLHNSTAGQQQFSSVLVPSSGKPREVARFNNVDSRTAAGELDFLDRRTRVQSFPDYLVGRSDGQKVYLPLREASPIDVGGVREGSLGQLRYERVSVGEPVAHPILDTETPRGFESDPFADVVFMRPQGLLPPRHEDGGRSTHTVRTAGGRLVVLLGGVRQPEAIIYTEGNSGQTGYGPQGLTFSGYGCSHYNVRDECKNCCLTTFMGALAIVIGAGVSCHIVSSICIPCHIGCGIAEAAATGALIYGRDQCERNCDRKVTW